MPRTRMPLIYATALAYLAVGRSVFLCTSKPAHRASMTCIASSARRDSGWRGYLQRQILTCVLNGNSWRCLQVSGSDWWTGSGAPLYQTTSGPAAQPELYHIFMGGGDYPS